MTASKPIPNVAAPPWIGSLVPIAKDAPAFFARQHQKLGPVFAFKVLSERILVLAGRNANQFANKAGADCFSSHGI